MNTPQDPEPEKRLSYFEWLADSLLKILDEVCFAFKISWRPSRLFHDEEEIEEEVVEESPVIERPDIPCCDEEARELEDQFGERRREYEERLKRRERLREERERSAESVAKRSNSDMTQATIPFQDVTDKDWEEPPEGEEAAVQPDLSEKDPHSQEYVLEKPYVIPEYDLLKSNEVEECYNSVQLDERKQTLQATLDSFAIDAEVQGATVGPRVTLFEVDTAPGIKVETVTHITGNIAMDMCAPSLRILTPIPGRPYVGIEVPNEKSSIVGLKEMFEDGILSESTAKIPLLLGKNINGTDMVLDLAKAPHLMIAGATGSGKSVCLNSMIMSLLYKFSPDKLRLILVDPKVVEFSGFAKLPHLIVPVITEMPKVTASLRWVVKEMEDRYRVLAKVGARNLDTFNNRPYPEGGQFDDEGKMIPREFPFIVVIIDELADIMMNVRQEVETYLARIAQLSRAVGIHTIIATQRPSVNVITGIIKANYPTRIAFQVSSLFDSRTILDSKGAESLLGSGDMLYKAPGAVELQRIQSPYVSDEEMQRVVDVVSGQADQKFNESVMTTDASAIAIPGQKGGDNDEENLIQQAIEIILQDKRPSTSYIQRRLKIGYNRAASIIDEIESRGIIGPPVGASAKREILIES